MLGDGSVFKEKGKIDLANREVDPETGSLLIQAIFPNPQKLVRPGQYVKVRFKTDEYSNAILIPQQAVTQLQSIYQVFLLNDSSKIEPRVIKVGARVGSNWIVTDGLKQGDKIAIIGNALLTPGMTVKPVTMNWDYNTTSGK
jgi:membrane fusion protein (multidrug efflux system)